MKVCTGYCSRERYFDNCQCEDCVLYASIGTGSSYNPGVLGVMGLIAFLYAWNEWTLAREIVRQKYRARVDAIEVDGRYIGEIEALPGCIAYGDTEGQARDNARHLGVAIVLDRVRAGEPL